MASDPPKNGDQVEITQTGIKIVWREGWWRLSLVLLAASVFAVALAYLYDQIHGGSSAAPAESSAAPAVRLPK